MNDERVVNPIEEAKQAAIATRLMTEKIKPEAFIRYFVAVKNNWPTIYFYRLFCTASWICIKQQRLYPRFHFLPYTSPDPPGVMRSLVYRHPAPQ